MPDIIKVLQKSSELNRKILLETECSKGEADTHHALLRLLKSAWRHEGCFIVAEQLQCQGSLNLFATVEQFPSLWQHKR